MNNHLDPISLDAERVCAEARVMFQRVLQAWAMDALSLRKRGLDRPKWRDPEAEGTQLLRDAA